MKKFLLIVSTGFALFSMFFGSGNLVFPIAVGRESEGHYLIASLGILLTGVLVPFLGVIGMALYKGESHRFFECFGKRGTFLFSFFALALMGPFGVLARCLTVAHGSLELIFPGVPLTLTSFLLCALIFFFTVNKSKIVSIVGSVLTPILLAAIALIAYFGLSGGLPSASVDGKSWEVFKNGFFQGYQTMDLLAALFFSNVVLKHLHRMKPSTCGKLPMSLFFQSTLVGALILSLVYFALVILGSIHAPFLDGRPAQEMLGTLAIQSLGPMAAPIVCVAVVFACLTTAIVLTYLFADFFRVEITGERITNWQALLTTLAIGFLVSTLDFEGISRFLGPILELTYPALIVLTLGNIRNVLWGTKSSHWPFTLTLVVKACMI